MAIAGVTPYIGFALIYLYGDFRTAVLPSTVAGAFASMVLIAYGGGVFVCLVNEMVTRRSFVKDRIIQKQRRQLADSRDAIRRYMPPAVAQRIIRGESASVETPLRRRVTILFCDLKGSTALSERLDPEAMHTLKEGYFDAMALEITRHGGKIEKYIGDAIMAVFGLPRAHEDDALRAVRFSEVVVLLVDSTIPFEKQDLSIADLAARGPVRIGVVVGRAMYAVHTARVAARVE